MRAILIICLALACITACKQEPPPLQIRLIPEMTSFPEETWPACDASHYRNAVQQTAIAWIYHREQIIAAITPQKVRDLSRWAQTEMATYPLPAFKNLTFQAVKAQHDNLLIESLLDTLPSHHPLVTRQLKLYLVYHLKEHRLTDAIITIRGWAEE